MTRASVWLLLGLAPFPCWAQGAWKASGSLAVARWDASTTVLTDGRVLLAGGQTGASSWTAAAEIFDPATGTWSATGTMPTIRSDHAAVLLQDGRVMVIGGQNSAPAVAAVEIWDPNTGLWTATGSLTTARWDHTATLLPDGRVLVVGGQDTNNSYTAAEIWDPATGLWTDAGNSNVSRTDHAAALLPDGRVLVLGGGSASSSSAVARQTCEIWSAGSFTYTGPLAEGRKWLSATALPDGRVLAVGGNAATTSIQTAEVWTSGTWSAAGSMATPRDSHTATLLPDGRVFVTGGLNGSTVLGTTALWSGGSFSAGATLLTARESAMATVLPSGRVLVAAGVQSAALLSAEVWDPQGGSWAGANPMSVTPSSNAYHNATPLADGRVLVTASQSVAEIYNPFSGAWSTVTGPTVLRDAASATLLQDGKVLVAAGNDGTTVHKSAEVWDPDTGLWTATAGSMTAGRINPRAVLLADGRVMFAGGNSGGVVNPPGMTSVEIWNPADGTFTTVNPLNTARRDHVLVALPDGKVFAAGGADGSTILSSVEIWDPATGAWTTTAAMSSNREFFTGTVLSDGRVMIVGGEGGPPLIWRNNSQIWDPATGTWSALATMSSAHVFHTATQLPDGRVLVAGGETANQASTAVAEIWDPATSTWNATGNLIGARDTHTATLLADGRVLVAGGFSGSTTIATAELWRSGPVPANACLPGLAAFGGGLPADPWPSGTTITAAGSQLTGCSQGSGGGNIDAPGNAPQIVFSSLSDEKLWGARMTRSRNWKADRVTFTVPGDSGIPPGYYQVRVIVNGIVSTARRYVRITRSHDKLYLHRESTNAGATRDLLLTSPAAAGHGTVRDGALCQAFGTAGRFLLQNYVAPGAACSTSVQTGQHLYPAPAGGFAAARAVSGPWTLRADVQRVAAAGGGGSAFLFARIKRHSDGCLVHQTERLTDLNLVTLATTWRQATVRAVVPPRTTDCCATPGSCTSTDCPADLSVACASTRIPAGDRMRLEWWVDVTDVDASRRVELAMEAPGSTAGSFAVLATESLDGGPLASRILGLEASAVGNQVEVSFTLADPSDVVTLQVRRGALGEGPWEPLGPALEPQFGVVDQPFVTDDDAPAEGIGYVVDLVLSDGTVERYGPVSPGSTAPEDSPSGWVCGATATGPPSGTWAGVAAVALLALGIFSNRSAARR